MRKKRPAVAQSLANGQGIEPRVGHSKKRELDCPCRSCGIVARLPPVPIIRPGLVAEATGSRWTALLSLTLGLLALSSVLAWMFLPVFIYFGLRDLRRHAAELERATNLCAHHLSQLAADRRELSPPRLPGCRGPRPSPR
jgi:hypothetical protein